MPDFKRGFLSVKMGFASGKSNFSTLSTDFSTGMFLIGKYNFFSAGLHNRFNLVSTKYPLF